MAEIDMTRMNENIKDVARAVDAMCEAARKAGAAMNAFTIQHHDMMNATVSAEVLRGMGRPDIARLFDGRE